MPGFTNLPIEASSSDGLNWTLLKCLEYTANSGRRIRVKAGATTDGPSIPKAAWSLMAPTGKKWPAGVLHDGGYRNQLEMLDKEGEWKPITLPKDVVDDLIREALLNNGVSEPEATVIYEAVHLFGGKAFAEDRAMTPSGPGEPVGI